MNGANLQSIKGIGNKLSEKIILSLGGEEELNKVIDDVDLERLTAIEGISQRKAIEIMNQLLGNPAEKIKEMMRVMRNKTVDKIGDYKVLKFKDIDRDYVKDIISGEEYKSGLPKSNVLYYDLEDNSWCCVRPSGTEPKIKLYMGVKGNSMKNADEKLENLLSGLLALEKIMK